MAGLDGTVISLDDGGSDVAVARWTLFELNERLRSAQARHIAMHNPATMISEFQAKLEIVNMHEGCGTGVGHCDKGGYRWPHVDSGGCATLGHLALALCPTPRFPRGVAAMKHLLAQLVLLAPHPPDTMHHLRCSRPGGISAILNRPTRIGDS